MGFVYVPERERWRTLILLLWKRGALRNMTETAMRRIAEFAAPPWPTQPLRKLTVKLITTYTGINNSYYAAKKKWTASQIGSGGNFQWTEGSKTTLANRFELKQQIGHGAFGVVMRALDLQTGELVAIKIIKARGAYSQQARREIKLLQDLRAADSEGRSNVVELRGHFVFSNPGVGLHECLVFEMLSSNLYTLLEQVSFHGFSLTLVRKFAESLLSSLSFLARPDVRVIHTDIKPENICIRNPRRSAIKLIDFGSSCKEGEQIYSYIQSRYYRSPEVLMGCGYGVPIDTWSLACVLVEMHTGKPLFAGDDQVDQLRKIMEVLGPPPDAMVESYAEVKRKLLFQEAEPAGAAGSLDADHVRGSGRRGGRGRAGGGRGRASAAQRRKLDRRWVPIAPEDRSQGSGCGTRSLEEILGATTGGPQGRWRDEPGHGEQDYRQFIDLIRRMLAYDPAARLTPAEGLMHPFVVNGRRAASSGSSSSSSSSTPPSSSSPPPSSAVVPSHASVAHSAEDRSRGPAVDSMETEMPHTASPTPGSSSQPHHQHHLRHQHGPRPSAGATTTTTTAVGELRARGGMTTRQMQQQLNREKTNDEQDMHEDAREQELGLPADPRGDQQHPRAPRRTRGGPGDHEEPVHISQQHQEVLSSALHEIGCPENQLQKPLDWNSINELLERFTEMDESALLEARRRFAAFVDQPLRARRERALRHLLELLRECGTQAANSMEIEDHEDLSLTPAP